MEFELFIPALLGLQFVAFGWRLNREISVGDKGRRTWLPLPDLINIASMITVIYACIIAPMEWREFSGVGQVVLALGYVLIALHPINVAAHYRLFLKAGRSVCPEKDSDYPYATSEEIVSVLVTLVIASATGYWLRAL